MIDTHAHLDGEEFAGDLDAVVQRAADAGVWKMLVPNVNGGTLDCLVETCSRYRERLYPMIGLHPEDVNPATTDVAAVLADFERRLGEKDHPFVAIGEVGLDFYWDDTYRKEQLDAFERQVEWAARFGLPLMVHTRKAHREMVEAMERHAGQGLRGVFHCFTGGADEARDLLRFEGFMLGIGGVVTFKKSGLPDVLRQSVPLSRIVLETDAPYMAPVPHRGARNESAFVVEVAKRLAEVYGCSSEHIDAVTTDNARQVFGARIAG